MRYCLVCSVEGEFYLTGSGPVDRDDMRFDFRCDSLGKLKQIAASISVPEDKLPSMETKIGPGEGGSKLTISMGGDKELYDRLVTELQFLESDLAFATVGALRRIHWQDPSIEFIHETDEDRRLSPVSSLAMHKRYPEIRSSLSLPYIAAILHRSTREMQLRICKAFWREGQGYFREFKYIQAFYSFYFVIEDFFAGGKTSEKAVTREFNRSSEFMALSNAALNAGGEEDRHRSSLEEFFLIEGLDYSVEAMPRLLFGIRGNLHHYFSKSPRLQGTPFNQAEFESISLLVMFMATRAIETRNKWVKSNNNSDTGQSSA